MSYSKVQFFKRTLLEDFREHHILITREFLLQLLAVNKQYKTKTSRMLTQAIEEIWQDTFDCKILEIEQNV